MVQRDGKAVVVDAPQLLEQHLGLTAGIDEHQRGAMAPDEIVHLAERVARGVPGPRQPLGGIEHRDDRRSTALSNQDIGLRPPAGTLGNQVAGKLIRRRHGGGKPYGRQGWRDAVEARKPEREQIAALRRDQRMQFIEHDALERRKQIGRIGGRQQQCHLLGRGEQDVGRITPLPRTLRCGRVSGAGLDPYRQSHLGDWLLQVAGDIDRQGLEGGHV